MKLLVTVLYLFFFFNDTATTEIYTLSLHDALPIYRRRQNLRDQRRAGRPDPHRRVGRGCGLDRKSTRLNSSHLVISYAVFCLKKKNSSRYDTNTPSFSWSASSMALSPA